MSGDTPSYDLKARRIKQLLSSYYSTEQQTEGETGSQQSGGAIPDEVSSSTSVGTPKYSSIDSPAFNAETYVTSLVRTARIDTLLKRHGDMVKEIRSLDSDMQMLVYENYNKFISATDTIRSMKSNVDGMGEKMEELKDIMDRVAETSDGVNSKLQKHRDGIEELSRVKALLQKIQCVIDLPKRMAIAFKEQAFSVAVNNYCEARPLLKKYGHQGAFRSVASECETLIEEITQKLEQKLQDPEEDAEECVQLLQKIGSQPGKLQELFLTGRRARIDNSISEASRILSSMAAKLLGAATPSNVGAEWLDDESGHVTILSFVKSLNAKTLKRLCETASNFNATFSAAGQLPDQLLDRCNLIEMSKPIIEQYQLCISRAVAIAAIQGATEALELPSAGMTLPTEQDDAEIQPMAVKTDFGVAIISACLSTVMSELNVVECRLPEGEPAQAANFLIKSSIEHNVAICFKALTIRVIGTLVHIKKRTLSSQLSSGSILREFGMSDLQRLYAYLCDVLLKGLSSILEGLENYQTSGHLLQSWHGMFIDILQGQIHKLFATLLKSITNLAKTRLSEMCSSGEVFRDIASGLGSMPLPSHLPERSVRELAGLSAVMEVEQETAGRSRQRSKCPSAVVLLCARLCTFLEITLVPKAVEMLATLFPGAGVHDQPAFNPSEIIRQANNASSELLRVYIELYSRSLTLAIRQSIAAANWLHHKEPRGPRPICDLIIARLEISEKEIVQLVDDGGNRSSVLAALSIAVLIYGCMVLGRNLVPGHKRDPSSTSLDASETAEGTVLERNVAKLFRERVQLDKKAEFTQSSIQAAILSGGLKSLIECIRRETLGRAGLQQIQLDILYLRPLVSGFVRGKETEAVAALLEEVITAAVDRSVDPTLLETAVIDKILMADNH